jgi:hypothetical protein
MGGWSCSVVGSRGELCGLWIVGMGDADVRVGKDNRWDCVAGLGGSVIGVDLAPPRGISSLSIVFGILLTCFFFLSRVIRWSDVGVLERQLVLDQIGPLAINSRPRPLAGPARRFCAMSYQVHFRPLLCQWIEKIVGSLVVAYVTPVQPHFSVASHRGHQQRASSTRRCLRCV